MMRLTLALSALGLATVANAWTDSNCKKFSEIYTGGEDLITRMWGDSFKYERDESKAYTMWWTEGGAAGVADAHDNPNDLVTAAIIGSVDNKAGFNVSDQTCEVAYYHKVGPPTPETEDFTECHPWHANACCHQATVVTPEAINKAYGAGHEWDRCGPMSQACERFFVEEACMYECDANMGVFRKYTDEEKALCKADGVAAGATVTKADGSTYTCVEEWGENAENAWEIHQMPIKASYADAFYRACANDYFCDSGSFWTCEAEYHAHLAELAANKTKAEEEEAAKLKLELEAEKKKTKAEEEEAAKLKLELEAEKKNKDKGLPAWAIALIVVLSLLGLLCCTLFLVLVVKEKQGKPMFVTMADDKDVQMNKA